KMRVPVTAAPSSRDQHALAGLGEIMKLLAAFKVIHDCSPRHRDLELLAVLSVSIAAFTVFAAAGAEDVVVAELEECVVLIARDDVDAAAVATVTAAGTAPRDELLPQKGDASVPAVSGTDGDLGFVDEHGGRGADVLLGH